MLITIKKTLVFTKKESNKFIALLLKNKLGKDVAAFDVVTVESFELDAFAKKISNKIYQLSCK